MITIFTFWLSTAVPYCMSESLQCHWKRLLLLLTFVALDFCPFAAEGTSQQTSGTAEDVLGLHGTC